MPVEVFVSYAHEDIHLRQELDKQLKMLNRQGIITSWTDSDISPGTEWRPQIMQKLNSAKIILLLISADFIASDFCFSIEMKRALERHEAGDARVLPVILRPVYWQIGPFSKLQVLPQGGKPVIKWPTHDEGFENVARGIAQAAAELTNA